MGGGLSKVRKARCILFGLDSVGKTTLLYKLKQIDLINPIPTLGFNVEEIDYKGFRLSIWDIGGNDRKRFLIDHFCYNTNAVIFVVDSNDIDRLDEAKEKLSEVLQKEVLRDSILLIYANKQDLPNAIKPQELIDRLQLNVISDRAWHVQGSCSTNGDGLFEGLDWLVKEIDSKFF